METRRNAVLETVKQAGARRRLALREAKVAVARKLAVVLHRMWIDGSEFN
jgi:hypothetical protein